MGGGTKGMFYHKHAWLIYFTTFKFFPHIYSIDSYKYAENVQTLKIKKKIDIDNTSISKTESTKLQMGQTKTKAVENLLPCIKHCLVYSIQRLKFVLLFP